MCKFVETFDTTLRDGAQAHGISLSVADKLSIAALLDDLGVTYIEGGNPAASAKELAFFEKIKEHNLKNSILVAFGSTRRKNILPQDDKNIKALLKADTCTVAIFGKCWDLHVAEILKTTQEENEAMIKSTIEYLISKGKKVIFDAEHFFDGYKSNKKMALSVIKTASLAGAFKIVLCDTNGGCFPNEICDITKEVSKTTEIPLGIHCHNDCGLAVANSLSAADAGALHVQGTFLGFGERAGNACLSTLIPDMQIKQGYKLIKDENLCKITNTARAIAEICNIHLSGGKPYVGRGAFAHKAGMHSDGVLKNSKAYEHIDPSLVGNERILLVSDIAGKGVILHEARSVLDSHDKNSRDILTLSNQIKELEHFGYQFEGAKASLELLALKITGKYKSFFELINYEITAKNSHNRVQNTTASIQIKVKNRSKTIAHEGNGPVNALDSALRKALNAFYPSLCEVHLTDYKVRVIDSSAATGAKVRVLITSSNGQKSWSTVGVSTDIIEASLKALIDSMEYILMTENKH